MQFANESALYDAPGPKFDGGQSYGSQAEVAFVVLMDRNESLSNPSIAAAAFRQVFRALGAAESIRSTYILQRFDLDILKSHVENQIPKDNATRLEFASLAKQVARNLASQRDHDADDIKRACAGLNEWAASLERKAAKAAKNVKSAKKAKAKSKASAKRSTKKSSKRRKAS